MPVRITIDITYEGEEPDHSQLLGAFQDHPVMLELLSPNGEKIEEHEACVQELKKGMK